MDAAPKIELRKFQASDKLSQETLLFSADVYVDGKRAGHARNDGRGGATFVRYVCDEASALVREYIRSLPPLKMDFGEITQDEDVFFSQLAEKMMQQKHDAKASKQRSRFMETARANGQIPFEAKLSNGSVVMFTVRPGKEMPSEFAVSYAKKHGLKAQSVEEMKP